MGAKADAAIQKAKAPKPGSRTLRPSDKRQWTNAQGHTVRVVTYR